MPARPVYGVGRANPCVHTISAGNSVIVCVRLSVWQVLQYVRPLLSALDGHTARHFLALCFTYRSNQATE